MLHARALRAGGVQCFDLRGDFGGISSTSYIVRVGHKGATTYVLQQDGGDSNMRSGDEAVHSLELSLLCHHHAVLYAHAPRAGDV